MGKGKGQKVMDFDLATAMTKKENRKLTKMECMVNSHLPPPPPPPPVRRPRALVPHSANAFGQSRPMTARVILCACAAVRPSASRAESP